MVADEISEVEWQMWVDQLSREGLSRSRIANHVAVISSIYTWALSPSRRFVTRNPMRMVELPPNDEKSRLRVALVPEAEQLLAALTPEDRVPYALACYSGLRRSEIHRLEWPEVLQDGKIASHVLVLRSKSEAGTQRRPPIAEPLQQILREAWLRQGRPTSGPVCERSVMSGKLAAAATSAWDAAGLNRITLHECRHTYASMLMAAHYTLKELMEYMGHQRPADGQPLREAAPPAARRQRRESPQRVLARVALGMIGGLASSSVAADGSDGLPAPQRIRYAAWSVSAEAVGAGST